MMDYQEYLSAKAQLGGNHGFAPVSMPDYLFDFQQALVEWALLKGRAAIFADCGLGIDFRKDNKDKERERVMRSNVEGERDAR